MGGLVCECRNILLSRGDEITRAQVVCWNHDTNGNPIGRSNKNPTLDTHLYEVEFPGGEMTELAANIIAESIYVQCDAFKNYRKKGSAFSVEDQMVVINGQETLKKSTAG